MMPAPFVINPQTGRNVLRLRPGEPGSSGLNVEIDPPVEGFEPGAQVHMTWTAETAQGVITVVDLGTGSTGQGRCCRWMAVRWTFPIP